MNSNEHITHRSNLWHMTGQAIAAVGPFLAELRQSKTDPGTYTHYRFANATATEATFTDVDTGWHYKARTRSCAAAVRKLCGGWSVLSAVLPVPTPDFPTLTKPTIAIGTNGIINASFTLPSATFKYLLKLQWSENSKDYIDQPNPASLQHGTTSHTFTGLQQERGGYYIAVLSACVDSARKNCGTGVPSDAVSMPSINLGHRGDFWVGEGSPRTVTAVTSGLTAGQAYTVRVSVATSNVGNLRFNECGSMTTALVSKILTIPSSNRSRSVTKEATLYSCGPATGTLSVDLLSGTTEVASHSGTSKAVHLPTGVRVNGHGSSTTNQFVVRWDPVDTATSYKIQYAIADNASGIVITVHKDDWTELNHTSSTTEKTVTGLTAGRIYEVQVKPVRAGVSTAWTQGAYVKPTHQPPTPKTKFAGIPMTKYWADGTYSYEICTETFPTTTWSSEIEAAIAMWPRHVKWVTDGSNVISKIGTSSDCGSSTCYGENPEDECPAIDQLTSEHRIIRAYDQTHFNLACGLAERNVAVGCVHSERTVAGSVLKTLMVFGSDDIRSNWGIDDHANAKDECSYLFDVAMHEAGHAFALGDVLEHANSAINSAMRQGTPGPCLPFAEDIGAMMMMYQSIP